MKAVMTEPELTTSLVRNAQGGDRSAFDSLARAFEDRLRSFVVSRIPPGSGGALDADEIVQDTLVRAFGSLDSFRGSDAESFRRWLTGVANKTVLRALEQGRRNRTLELPAQLPAQQDSPSRAMRREERFDHLQSALESLSGDHREVVRLTRIEGLSLKEAGERMGRSPDATRKLFWRALQQLRSQLSNTASLHLPGRRLELEDQHDGE